MSLHKLTAETAYTYLTRQVAAHDRTPGPRTSLASYYSEKGETPSRWVGSGVAGIDGLSVGDEVTALQMRALFGAGSAPAGGAASSERLEGPGLSDRDFKAVTRLGVPFKVYSAEATEATAFRVEVARRIEDHAASLGHPRRLPARRPGPGPDPLPSRHGDVPLPSTVGTRATPGSCPGRSRDWPGLETTAVGGFDLTFSPVKSVSTLWAIAPPSRSPRRFELAHNEAVADALAFLEKHALYSRERAPTGCARSTSPGLVAAAFTHRDSRAGDPDLHTHVAVANKVQTLSEGKWLSIDGRILFKAKVTASETYNTALEKHLRTRLGLVFAERPGTERGKRPVREVVGVDPALNQPLVVPARLDRGPPRRTGDRVPGRPRPPADGGGGDPAGPAGHLGDPRRQARTTHPDRATRRLAAAGRGRPRRRLRGVSFMVATALSARPRRHQPRGGCGVGAGHRASGPRRDPGPPLDLAGLARARRGPPSGTRRQPARRARRRGRGPGRRPHPHRRLGAAHSRNRRHRGAARAARRRRVQRVRGRRVRGLHQ